MKTKRYSLVICLLFFTLSLSCFVSAETVRWEGLSRTFILNSNIYPHYTGPAAVESVLYYLSGVDYDQEDVAAACATSSSGTHLKPMADCINDSQSAYKVAVYNGRDEQTVAYSLYDTVVRRDIPAIIGINTEGVKGWPFYREGSRYVLVFGISSDLSQVKLADPSALTEAGKKACLPRFYAVPTASLYAAYAQANTGLLYGVDPGKKALPTEPAENSPGLSAKLTLDSTLYRQAQSPHPKLTLHNSGNLSFTCGSYYELQKYNSVKAAWETLALPSHVVWTTHLIELKPGESYEVDDYLLEYTKAGPGIYRFAKAVTCSNAEVWAVSPMFEVIR